MLFRSDYFGGNGGNGKRKKAWFDYKIGYGLSSEDSTNLQLSKIIIFIILLPKIRILEIFAYLCQSLGVSFQMFFHQLLFFECYFFENQRLNPFAKSLSLEYHSNNIEYS